VLATRCERGPFCITGEVDDQFSIAVEGAKAIALLESGSRTVLSDARGVFFMTARHAAAPGEIREGRLQHAVGLGAAGRRRDGRAASM